MAESSGQGQGSPPVGRGALVRRPAGLLWWVAAVVVPIVLTAVLVVVRSGAIEDDLRGRALDALETQGITSASVEFSGRDATVEAPAGADLERIRAIVEGVDGVRVVDAASTGSPTGNGTPTETTPTPSPTPTEPAASPFSVSRLGEIIEVTGSAPDAATKNAMLKAANAQAGGRQVEDRITVDPTAKPPPSVDIGNLVKIAAAVQGDVSVNYDGTTVTLTGQVADEPSRVAAEKAAVAAMPKAEVSNQLRVGSVNPHEANCRVAQSRIIQILASNKINFQPETTTFMPGSRLSIAKVAVVLRACGAVRVEVAGHTDSRGNPGNSIPLSQQRAAAVQAELVRIGIDPKRIRAKGYGHLQPIASNATVAGRTANRRVEIRVL